MPIVIRFLFKGNDLAKISLPTLSVEDVGSGGPPSSPEPGSMLLRFRQSDPGPVQVCPLLPGAIRFLADPAAPGILPVQLPPRLEQRHSREPTADQGILKADRLGVAVDRAGQLFLDILPRFRKLGVLRHHRGHDRPGHR